MSLDAYSPNHIDFSIDNIEWEDDGPNIDPRIDFEYGAPGISVDGSGRFVKHEIIGGTTVRQKIGEDPLEVDISGVCKQEKAKKLDNLRDAKYGTIHSVRLPGDSLDVQFASISTSPLDDAGAVALDDGREGVEADFLYTFDLSTVEIIT